MKEVTLEFLKRHLKGDNACEEVTEWWLQNCQYEPTEKQLEKLFNHKPTWANWLIVRLLDRKDKVHYAIFAAKQVLYIFEDRYPADKRPRKAIEAAIKYLERGADADFYANYDGATFAADAAASAAYSARFDNAAAEAAYAAAAAAAAAVADADADDPVYFASITNQKAVQKKILEYGITLLKGKDIHSDIKNKKGN